MSAAAIPDEVVLLVLKELLSYDDTSHAFRANLPLLAICQQWRRITLPMVFSCVFLHYQEGAGPHIAHVDQHGAQDLSPKFAAKVVTNLGLYASAGCVRLAKRAKLYIYSVSTELSGVRRAAEMMRSAATEWPAVQSLDFTAGCGRGDVRGDGAADAKHEENAQSLSCAFASLMPNVRGVSLHPHADVGPVRRFCEQLVDLYEGQLRRLRYFRLMALSLDGQFKQLTDVYINCIGEFGRQFPCMNPTRLEWLTIINAHPNSLRAALSTHGDSRVIEFPELRYIDLYSCDTANATDGHPDRRPLQLLFPQLQSATIACPTGVRLVLECGVLPPIMDKLYICGNAATFRFIATIVLPVVKQLVLQIDYSADDDSSVFRSLNRIFVAARKSEKRRLRISGDRLPFQLENIAFTGLTDLWTTTPTGVDAVLGCIRKLPLLTSLTIAKCTLGDIQTDVTVPDSGEHEAIEPFKTRIQRLQLRMCRDSFVYDSAVMVVKYLLLRMPSVVRFATTDIPQQPIARFVSEYSRQYPHLVNVAHILLEED